MEEVLEKGNDDDESFMVVFGSISGSHSDPNGTESLPKDWPMVIEEGAQIDCLQRPSS